MKKSEKLARSVKIGIDHLRIGNPRYIQALTRVYGESVVYAELERQGVKVEAKS